MKRFPFFLKSSLSYTHLVNERELQACSADFQPFKIHRIKPELCSFLPQYYPSLHKKGKV